MYCTIVILCLECFHCYIIIIVCSFRLICCTFQPMVALINHLLTYLLTYLHHVEIVPEEGASNTVKLSQQVAKLCQKLKWFLLSWTRCILLAQMSTNRVPLRSTVHIIRPSRVIWLKLSQSNTTISGHWTANQGQIDGSSNGECHYRAMNIYVWTTSWNGKKWWVPRSKAIIPAGIWTEQCKRRNQRTKTHYKHLVTSTCTQNQALNTRNVTCKCNAEDDNDGTIFRY